MKYVPLYQTFMPPFFRMHITITFSAFLKLYEKFKISILLLFSDSKKYPEVVPADNSCMANIITN
jgi:hypothetical protein